MTFSVYAPNQAKTSSILERKEYKQPIILGPMWNKEKTVGSLEDKIPILASRNTVRNKGMRILDSSKIAMQQAIS
jgi:hypothetical protein